MSRFLIGKALAMYSVYCTQYIEKKIDYVQMIIKTFFLSPKKKYTSEIIVVVMVVACIIEVIDALRDVRICGEETNSIYIIGQ